MLRETIGKTRILLAENYLVVRDGIKLLLDNEDNLEVVADVCCGREILDLIAAGVEADILMTDLNMDNGGFRFIKDIHERSEEHTSELQSRENLVCRLLLA